MNITPVVKQLIIINILFFICSQIVGDDAYKLLSLHYFENPDFNFWQLFTHMFMHAPIYQNNFRDVGGITHIIFNMYGLYMFGSPLEHFWGAKRFLIFYFICGLGAALVNMGVGYYHFHEGLNFLTANGYNKTEVLNVLAQGKYGLDWPKIMPPTMYSNFMDTYVGTVVGASGAIYGVIVAFAFMFPDAGLMLIFVPYPIKAKYFVPVLVLLDLFSGVTGFSIFGGGIAHFAHVGGALFGFILMMIWRNNKFNHNRIN